MGKLIKWLFSLILIVIVVLITAVIVLPLVVDPNDYKAEIVAAVEEKTGRSFMIEQDLQLSVFPWLGAEAGGVRLGNAEGFGDKPFAQIEHLAARVKVMPLLSRQIEVDTLVLDGLQLNLAKDAQGKTNWADLQDRLAKTETPEKTDNVPEEQADDESMALLGFMVGGVEIKNMQAHWQDAQSGQDYKVQDVHILAGNLSPGGQTPLEMGLQLHSQKPKLDLTLKLKTDMVSSKDLQHYQLRDLQVDTQAKGDGLPEQGMQLGLGAQVDLDLAKDTLAIQALQLKGPQTALQGQIAVSKLSKQPQVQGKLQLAETNVKQLARLFGVEIVTQNAEALSKVSADLELAHDGKVLKINPLNMQLDNSKIQGYVHLLDPQGPVLRSKLSIDRINVDDYLPPVEEPKAANTASAKAATAAPAKKVQGNPLAALLPLDVQLETQIGDLVVNKAKMQAIQVKLSSQKGLLKITPFKAKLYDGKFDGNITVDARGKTAKVHAIKHLTGIQVGALLKDVAQQDRLLGRGDVHVDMRVTGLTEPEIRRSLNGTANFRFLDGAFKGVNIAQLVRDAKGVLGGKQQSAAEDNTDNQTDFAELSGSVVVKNGVINNQDLQAKSPLLRIEGKGTVNLPEDKIDYRLVTELVDSLQGQGGKGRDELSGIPIAVKVKGPLTNPSYSPDLEGMLNAKAKQKIEEEKQKLRAKAEEKIKDKIGEKAGDLFKGLFGN